MSYRDESCFLTTDCMFDVHLRPTCSFFLCIFKTVSKQQWKGIIFLNIHLLVKTMLRNMKPRLLIEILKKLLMLNQQMKLSLSMKQKQCQGNKSFSTLMMFCAQKTMIFYRGRNLLSSITLIQKGNLICTVTQKNNTNLAEHHVQTFCDISQDLAGLPENVTNPLEAFSLIITNDLLSAMVDYTNANTQHFGNISKF